MSFLKKLFVKDPVPAWASYMSESDYRSMKRDIESVIRQAGIPATFDWDQGLIQLPNQTLGLQNLSQLYRQVPVESRPAVIAEWVGITKGPPSTDMSPEEMRKCLRMRVQPEDYLAGSPLETWVYPVCEGLIAITAIDTPTAIVTTGSSELEANGLTREEAWEIGIENLRDHEEYEIESVTPPGRQLVATLSWRLHLCRQPCAQIKRDSRRPLRVRVLTSPTPDGGDLVR
jgi:hypothetical protein